MKHTKKNQPHATKQLAKAVERECRQMKEKTVAEAARSSLATLQENFEKQIGLDIQEQWAKEDNNRLNSLQLQTNGENTKEISNEK